MIPDLLWRCPLCASNDALRHRDRWPRPEVVDCTACGARWRVRRVVGDNYYLKIVRAGRSAAAFPPGTEFSITAWYDLMKQTVHLEALPGPANLLEAGETLYLASGQCTLWLETQPIFSEVGPPTAAEPGSGLLGAGKLFLTDRRLLWRKSSAAEPAAFTFPLRQANGIHAILNLGIFFAVGTQLYTLRFANESPLKWVTYAALLAQQVQAGSGHLIHTSHY